MGNYNNSMIDTLKALRQAGFFAQYGVQTDDEILNKIHEERKQRYSKIFGYPYEPERNLSDQELASQDTSKMLHLDLEADVCRENKVYSWLLKVLDGLSGRKNIITDIVEEWESETGPINVSFNLNSEKKFANPEYHDDWVDPNFINNILTEISKVINQSFHVCLGPNEEWLGQDVNYMRLTQEERKILCEKLNWKFFDDFLEGVKNNCP